MCSQNCQTFFACDGGTSVASPIVSLFFSAFSNSFFNTTERRKKPGRFSFVRLFPSPRLPRFSISRFRKNGGVQKGQRRSCHLPGPVSPKYLPLETLPRLKEREGIVSKVIRHVTLCLSFFLVMFSRMGAKINNHPLLGAQGFSGGMEVVPAMGVPEILETKFRGGVRGV